MFSLTPQYSVIGAAKLLASAFSLLKVCWLFTVKTTTAVHTRISQRKPQRPEPVSSSQTSPAERSTVASRLAGKTCLWLLADPPRLQRGPRLCLQGQHPIGHNQLHRIPWTIPSLYQRMPASQDRPSAEMEKGKAS